MNREKRNVLFVRARPAVTLFRTGYIFGLMCIIPLKKAPPTMIIKEGRRRRRAKVCLTPDPAGMFSPSSSPPSKHNILHIVMGRRKIYGKLKISFPWPRRHRLERRKNALSSASTLKAYHIPPCPTISVLSLDELLVLGISCLKPLSYDAFLPLIRPAQSPVASF